MSEDDIKVIEGRIYRRWNKEDITKPTLKAKISFEESFQMLVNKCMVCPAEERPQNIYMLFWSTPKLWRDEILNEEMTETIETVEYTTPKIWCGVPLENDAIVKTVEETKWEQLFNAILNCANRRNLLIPMERTEIVTEPTGEE
jgi:hypothetical protein